MNGDVLKQE